MVTDNRCLKFSITCTPRSLALPSWLSIKGTFLLCLSTPAWQVNLCLLLPRLEVTQPWSCCRGPPDMLWGSEAPKRGLNLLAESVLAAYMPMHMGSCVPLLQIVCKCFWGVFSAQGCKGNLSARLSRSNYHSHNILNQKARKLAWKILRKDDAAA